MEFADNCVGMVYHTRIFSINDFNFHSLNSANILLISYFSASGKALSSGHKILPGGRMDSRTDVRPAT